MDGGGGGGGGVLEIEEKVCSALTMSNHSVFFLVIKGKWDTSLEY